MFYYYLISKNQIILIMNTVELKKKCRNWKQTSEEVHRSHDSQCQFDPFTHSLLLCFLPKIIHESVLFYLLVLPLPDDILAPRCSKLCLISSVKELKFTHTSCSAPNPLNLLIRLWILEDLAARKDRYFLQELEEKTDNTNKQRENIRLGSQKHGSKHFKPNMWDTFNMYLSVF